MGLVVLVWLITCCQFTPFLDFQNSQPNAGKLPSFKDGQRKWASRFGFLKRIYIDALIFQIIYSSHYVPKNNSIPFPDEFSPI